MNWQKKIGSDYYKTRYKRTPIFYENVETRVVPRNWQSYDFLDFCKVFWKTWYVRFYTVGLTTCWRNPLSNFTTVCSNEVTSWQSTACWVYTFSATPRFLWIWAPDPSWETGCVPALPAQLCWSSDSSFQRMRNTSIWTWFVIEIIHQSRGNDSITFRFFRCPGVFAIAMVSLTCCKFPIIAK